MSHDVDEPLLETVHSGWIGQCGQVDKFEEVLSNYIGNDKCLTLSAGTHGLHLALRLLGVGNGDEVITTPLTCTATNWPILMQGANIVWADVNRNDLNISYESIKDKITDRTRAIIVMHWGGYPCDMREIYKIANDRRIPVIEDAAHAFGSMYENSFIGKCEYSDFTMFSFQAIKHLTCGDGGALFCRRLSEYRRGKLLRWYGIDREGPRKDLRCEEDVVSYGYKYHMNDISAIMGIYNMPHAIKNIEKARENALYYEKELSDFSGITLTQVGNPEKLSSYWIFSVLVEDRTGFSYKMGSKGIMVSRVHERNDIHTCVRKFKSSLPNLDYVVNKMICIPVGWWVTKEDREYIVSSIKEGW